MDYRSYEKRLEYILELVQKNRFRTVGDAAERFSCSTRTIKRMLNHLRDRGHDIRRGPFGEAAVYAVVF